MELIDAINLEKYNSLLSLRKDSKSGQCSERGGATTGSAGRKKTKLKIEQLQQVRQMAATLKTKQKMLLYLSTKTLVIRCTAFAHIKEH